MNGKIIGGIVCIVIGVLIGILFINDSSKDSTREELLNSVWGFETAVETRATDDTVRRLRQKLDGSGVAIAAVWGYGFRLEVQA